MAFSSSIIAGSSSSAGKTTVAIGLMGALRKRGFIIQPFKTGPDYIDPSHHSAVCGRASYNLDTWMMGAEEVKNTFSKAMSSADVGIIEGVMGLFDGKDRKDESGSTAHLAKVLDIGVILVVDARGMSRSAAALVYGFKNFDKKVKISGVIFNRAGSERHFKILKEAVENHCGVDVLGYLPDDGSIAMPERHLGLVMSSKKVSAATKRLSESIEKFVDIDKILTRVNKAAAKYLRIPAPESVNSPRIAVACDDAFCFYYRQNLDILEELGSEVVFFSPLKDKRLPKKTDGIYLGGGYPELHARRLERNKTLRQEIRGLARRGVPVYAECGGLMYLGKGLKDIEGKVFEMAGIFPWVSRMLPKRKSLGYREVMAKEGCPFLKKGQKIRGHEFHYSEITRNDKTTRAYFITDGFDEGYLYKNTLASYIHLHFASNRKFAEGFVNKCRAAANDGG